MYAHYNIYIIFSCMLFLSIIIVLSLCTIILHSILYPHYECSTTTTTQKTHKPSEFAQSHHRITAGLFIRLMYFFSYILVVEYYTFWCSLPARYPSTTHTNIQIIGKPYHQNLIHLIFFSVISKSSSNLPSRFAHFRSYVGRTTAASTATGSKAQHNKELGHLLETAFTL